jgi:nucleoside 2-deoxyribosyltransferase
MYPFLRTFPGPKARAVLVYLAGPIDDVTDAQARTWREDAATEVSTGLLLFSPFHAFVGTCNPHTIMAADAVNRLVIQSCDALIAKLDGPGRAFGTIREIEYAKLHQKHVVCVVGDQPLESLLTYDVCMATTIGEAIEHILEKKMHERQVEDRFAQMFTLPGVPEDEDQDHPS